MHGFNNCSTPLLICYLFFLLLFKSIIFRVDLDYGKEVHKSRVLVEMEQHNWLQNGFFTRQSLYYSQGHSNGELQAWMTWSPKCQHNFTR